jgi:hypothetical protein
MSLMTSRATTPPHAMNRHEAACHAVDGWFDLFLCSNLRAQLFVVLNCIDKADFNSVFNFRRLQ